MVSGRGRETPVRIALYATRLANGTRGRGSMAETAGDDRLGADAEPAMAVAPDRATQTEGHEDDGQDHDDPVDEGLPDLESGQHLGQEDQEARPQHRAEERG